MDRQILIRRFRHIISLASLAYAFTILHTIQYSMRDHDNLNDDTTAQLETAGDHDSTNFSASSTHNTVNTPTASASENLEKTSKWTEAEVKLLLDYVEANCILTTARGLNLKKSEFNRASAVVRTKDSNQCHYKWGNVGFFFLSTWRFRLILHYYRYALHTGQFHSGIRIREVVGTTTMGSMPEPQAKNKYLRNF